MRAKKPGSRRIEFKTRTDEQKILYEQKQVEMGFKTLSEMARHALEQLIEGNDMTSPEVFRLQRELQEKDERIMELEATLTKSKDAYQYLQDENKQLRIQNYGSVNGLNAVLMARQINAFIRRQNGVSRQEILSAIERPMEIQGLAEFLKAYVDDLLNEGTIVRMPAGNTEVFRWVK
jgi:predicted RNase H-like nuclease (RuvC/YqgF family)